MKHHALLLPVSVIHVCLFIPLASWVRTHPVNKFDLTLTRHVQQFHAPAFTVVSRCLSVLCSWKLVLPLTISVSYLLWRARQRVEALTIVSTAVLETVVRTGLQRLIARPRPSPDLVHVTRKKNSPSFPSGHAATAVCDWGWLLVIGVQRFKGTPGRRSVVLALLLTVIALAGPSRVYLGEHWPSDVLGGSVYGGAWFSLSWYLCSVFKQRTCANQ